MKNCLICQAAEDQASLLRLPVNLESRPLGDFLVCSECFQLLGKEKVSVLVRDAAMEGTYQACHVLAPQLPDGGESPGDDEGIEALRRIDLEVPEEALSNPSTLSEWVGKALAPLLKGQYAQGRGQINLLTSLTQDDAGYHFRAVLGD